MKFVFKAKNSLGKYESGEINAPTRESAVNLLQKENLFPVSLKEETEGRSGIVKTLFKYYDQVSEKEQVVFFSQLAILVEGRVPIVVALTAIKEQSTNVYLGKVIQEMIEDIEDGMSFSGAMEKQTDVFSNLAINVIRAGETSGDLKKSIEYIAENIERNYNLSSRVKSALIYPAIVMIVFFIIGFLVISFIVPKLTAIIKDLNADVPWYTQVLITSGDFMSKFWWAVALVMVGFVAGILYYIKTADGQKEWDQMKLKLPIFGAVFRSIYIARFAQNLAALLSSGIPIIRALIIVSEVVNNVVYQEILVKAAEEVKRGGVMSDVFRKTYLMPPMVTQMVKIGEDSGQIDAVLGHIAKFYDQETETTTKNLSTLIEPLLMIVIGLAVGFMSFSVLMPIYNIAGQIK
ncbi:MAG: type II secretion system F family protein [Parcubacteria group bacterium]